MLPLLAQALGPVQQDYLLEARQMQALSFAVHIPLVCFGVALPAMVLLVEWLGRRRGDEMLVALAHSWSTAMIGLFAIAVVTGTSLSFELGLLWPEFMATYGDVFGLAFGLEGFSFFTEAIFLAIYVYAWDRLSPAKHMLMGIPVVVAGATGSFFVIAVNGWMNNPQGFRLEDGRAVDVKPFDALFGNDFFWHEFVHMYLAAFIVTGFVMASVYSVAWLRGRRDRSGAGRRLGRAHRGRPPADQARRVRGSGGDEEGRRDHDRRLVRQGHGRREVRAGDPEAAVAALLPRPERDRAGPERGPEGRPAAGERRAPLVRDDGRDRHADGAVFGRAAGAVAKGGRRAPAALVPRHGRRARAALGGGPDRRLGDYGGGTPALGRLRADAHRGGCDRSGRDPAGLRDARRRLPRAGRGGGVDAAAPGPVAAAGG